MSSSLISGMTVYRPMKKKMELMITMYPEILLSFVVLFLVLYGINLSILKVSIGALFVIGVVMIHLWLEVFNVNDYLI